MKPVVKNSLGVIGGLVTGGIINMSLIMLSGSLVPPPEGVDVMDPESLKANIHLFENRHFIMPLLAHALGTLVGAFVAALIAANRKMMMALLVGVAFLAGGIINVLDFPAPAWFEITDIALAYLPMSLIGLALAKVVSKGK